jgi:hypothetical protein
VFGSVVHDDATVLRMNIVATSTYYKCQSEKVVLPIWSLAIFGFKFFLADILDFKVIFVEITVLGRLF